MDLDGDGLAVDAGEGGAADRGEHGAPPCWARSARLRLGRTGRRVRELLTEGRTAAVSTVCRRPSRGGVTPKTRALAEWTGPGYQGRRPGRESGVTWTTG